jgi:hypothetical protein
LARWLIAHRPIEVPMARYNTIESSTAREIGRQKIACQRIDGRDSDNNSRANSQNRGLLKIMAYYSHFSAFEFLSNPTLSNNQKPFPHTSKYLPKPSSHPTHSIYFGHKFNNNKLVVYHKTTKVSCMISDPYLLY